MTVKEKIRQLQAISVDAIMDAAIIENEDAIVDANRDQLYKRGEIDVTDPSHREKYAASTIKQKRRTARFPKTDFVTLKWTGTMHDSFKLFILKDFIAIRPTDIKWGLYIEGNDRFENAIGLTEESLKGIRDKVKTSFLKLLRYELH